MHFIAILIWTELLFEQKLLEQNCDKFCRNFRIAHHCYQRVEVKELSGASKRSPWYNIFQEILGIHNLAALKNYLLKFPHTDFLRLLDYSKRCQRCCCLLRNVPLKVSCRLPRDEEKSLCSKQYKEWNAGQAHLFVVHFTYALVEQAWLFTQRICLDYQRLHWWQLIKRPRSKSIKNARVYNTHRPQQQRNQ